jgi:hypothetical protein
MKWEMSDLERFKYASLLLADRVISSRYQVSSVQSRERDGVVEERGKIA